MTEIAPNPFCDCCKPSTPTIGDLTARDLRKRVRLPELPDATLMAMGRPGIVPGWVWLELWADELTGRYVFHLDTPCEVLP